MAESEMYQRGQALRRELMGEAFVERSAQTVYADPFMDRFLSLSTELIFGGVWSRPGIDLKTRTLICVISDVATGRTEELAIHLRMARRQGWTEDELAESIVHLLTYVGAPLVREAMLTAKEVFAQLRAEG